MPFIVHAPSHEYPVHLEPGALRRISKLLPLQRKVLIVTDSGVPESDVEAAAAACAQPHIVRLPAGEGSKSMDSLQKLLSAMLDAELTRSDCVLAIGGGMVGDLSGFAASVYQRGIDWFSVPTTLLAQVDASVGGKTAINFGGVKNSVGAFYPPCAVLIDTRLLTTLSERQLHAGLAEMIKMALTCDGALFDDIRRCSDLQAALPDLILRSLRIKQQIVEADFREAGLRRVLNFGHTVGHAIESCAQGSLLHGECVALGMLPFCGAALRAELIAVLQRYGLPTECPFPVRELMPFILHDKKRQADQIPVVFCDAPGSYRFQPMSAETLCAYLEEQQ